MVSFDIIVYIHIFHVNSKNTSMVSHMQIYVYDFPHLERLMCFSSTYVNIHVYLLLISHAVVVFLLQWLLQI